MGDEDYSFKEKPQEISSTKKTFENTEDLLSFLNIEHLEKLKQFFKQYPNSSVTKNEFLQITKILEDYDRLESLLIDLFNEIESNDEGTISWNAFLDYNIKFLQPKPKKLLEFGTFTYSIPPHVKRDPIAKIVLLETGENFCYVIVSKYGRVGLYNGNLHFLSLYFVIMTKEDTKRHKETDLRKRYRWITDAVFLPDVIMLVYVNSARSMCIYDVLGLKHVPLWFISGFPEVIESLHFISAKDNEEKRKLCMGLTNGQICVMIFQKPNNREELLRRTNDKLTFLFYTELKQQYDHVKIKNLGFVHRNISRKIATIKNDHLLVSCSCDPYNSVVIRDLKLKPETKFIFSMKWGANCFTISEKLKMLITGSEDGKIRLWNCYETKKPTDILKLHKTGVLDLVLYENTNLLLSCSRDATLKLCDLKHLQCLSNFTLKFPPIFEQVETKIENIHWPREIFYAGPKKSLEKFENKWERDFLLITCSNYLATAKLYFMDGKERYESDEAVILPPPPLQNNFLIPKDWEALSITSGNDEESEVKIPIDQFEKLDFILKKDLQSLGLAEETINFKIADLEEKKLKMKWAVERGAPFLALDLCEVKEISLPLNLPVASSKKGKSIAGKCQKLLDEASNHSKIFSDISSSTKSSVSSRTSIISFE